MTSRLDHTIVIPPSSPEQNWARSVSPCTPTRLFGLSPLSPSPPSLPSPSKLFEEFGLGPQNNPPSPKSPLARTVEKTAALRATAEKPLQNESSSKTGRPGSSKAKTVRNRKGSKSQETQNKIITGRVAKATAVSKTKDTSVSKAKAGVKKSKTGSQNENIKPTKEAEAEAKKVADSEGLNLEEALKRRLDWTPPRVSDLISVDVHSPSQSSGTKLSFGAALSNYHYDRENSLSESAHPSKEGNPTKRRRLELFEFEVLQERKPIQQKQTRGGETRKTKPKPKKQPKTITARVTARYEQIGDPEDLFVYEEKSSCEASVDFKKPTKPKKKTAAKQKEPEYIILSPDAATKSINDQNFLFGTCSQLERDDSPTFFNETQRATRLSESLAFEKTDSVMVTTASSTTSITNRFTGTKSHWSEAARDLNGALVQPEVIDMTDSPTVSTALSRLSELNPDAPKVASLVPSEDDFATDPLVDKGVITSSKPAADIQFTPLNSISDKAGPTTEPSTRKATSQLPEMPNFNGYTDSELSKQVLSYGFKAVRGRKKMIDLLEKCWQSKHGSAATSAASVETSSLVTINETVSVSTAKSSNTQVSGKMPVQKKKTKPLEGEPKTAGRAGKKASKKPAVGKADKSLEKAASPVRASTYMVDEIEDSEEEIIPSPTRIRMQHQSSSRQTTPAISCLALGNKSKQPSISTKTSAYDDSTLLELQNGITKAVHLQTRPRRSSDGSSHSPQLTWHEKILLYEPIILEDFAAWLNTEGFVSIYEDREVGVALVRTWCESQGICCTFRA